MPDMKTLTVNGVTYTMPFASTISIGQYNGDLNEYSRLMNTAAWISGANVTNSPINSGNYGVLETWGNGSGIVVQRVTDVNNNIATRVRYNNAFTAWKWDTITTELIGAQPLIGIGQYNGDLNDYQKLMNTTAWISGSIVTNSPIGSGSYGMLETWGNGSGNVVQRITNTNGNVVERTRYNGEFTEWAWVNPPMKLGAEYRTTERHEGKVVYAARINLGTVGTGRSTIVTDINATGIVRTSNMPVLFEASVFTDQYIYNIDAYVGGSGKIVCRTVIGSANPAENNMKITVWYTKD